ncbi:hypothetical protein Slin15195_G126310 [Septoria linicola]|uniref:F-box domain-containing protein n=1 Tax=Septoria linicola TaxID=215465 RepID=A0A9Q9EQY2_9PEZI|nr:hypothetical protein Slin14017_G082490 [Septoria linicola]USW59312.1 hypothetical protein Slin15195_G126310 [Septoria linicola]
MPFMELPGELRNRIYRLVRSLPERVIITETGYDRPKILAVSKTVRKEALSIYYLENKFYSRICHFDYSHMARFFDGVAMLEDQGVTPHAVPVSRRVSWEAPKWGNLLLWLKRHHLQDCTTRAATTENLLKKRHSVEFGLIAGMFAMTKGRRGRQSWNIVEGVLTEQRQILVVANVAWAED